jgi:hypothetical protein
MTNKSAGIRLKRVPDKTFENYESGFEAERNLLCIYEDLNY